MCMGACRVSSPRRALRFLHWTPVYKRHPRSVRRWLLFIALLHWLIFIILLLQGLAKHARNRRPPDPASPYVQIS